MQVASVDQEDHTVKVRVMVAPGKADEVRFLSPPPRSLSPSPGKADEVRLYLLRTTAMLTMVTLNTATLTNGYTDYGHAHYGYTHYGYTHYGHTDYGDTPYGYTHYGYTPYVHAHYDHAHYGHTHHCGLLDDSGLVRRRRALGPTAVGRRARGTVTLPLHYHYFTVTSPLHHSRCEPL